MKPIQYKLKQGICPKVNGEPYFWTRNPLIPDELIAPISSDFIEGYNGPWCMIVVIKQHCHLSCCSK